MRTLSGYVVASLLAAATPLAAQLPFIPIRIGIELGANYAHVAEQVFNVSNRTGALVGVTFAVHLLDNWSFETGAQYSMKGWTQVDPGTGDANGERNNYIEVPALLRYEFRNPSPITPFLVGGGGFSVQSSCEILSTPGTSTSQTTTSCAKIKTQTNGLFSYSTFDIGAIGGGGVALQLGAPMLSLAARYEYGLRALDNNGPKSRVVTLSAGISWPVSF